MDIKKTQQAIISKLINNYNKKYNSIPNESTLKAVGLSMYKYIKGDYNKIDMYLDYFTNLMKPSSEIMMPEENNNTQNIVIDTSNIEKLISYIYNPVEDINFVLGGSALFQKTIIVADSTYRDPIKNPQLNNWSLGLTGATDKSYGYVRNTPSLNQVKSIKLISAIIPNFYTSTHDDSLKIYARITEISGDIYTSFIDTPMFAELYFKNLTGNFFELDKTYVYEKRYFGGNSLPNLDKLTLSFYDQYGVLFDFNINDNLSVSSIQTNVTNAIVTTTATHNLALQDRIYFRNFSNASTAFTNEIQKTNGFIVDNIIDGTHFTCGINSTGITPVSTGTLLIKAKNQIQLTFEIQHKSGII